MKLMEIKEILEAEAITGQDKLDIDIAGGAAASDLMSDLLRQQADGALLLTGLATVQVIRTAVIAGMAAVVFVRGKHPDSSVTELAIEHGVPILSTPLNMYSSCGRLFQKGLRSIR